MAAGGTVERASQAEQTTTISRRPAPPANPEGLK